MSPEYSRGYAKHIRKEKEIVRREQPIITLPSWEKVRGMLDLRTHNDENANKLIRSNLSVLKQAYDGWFDVAAGKGRKKLDRFIRQYTQNENSRQYNPDLIDDLAPFISWIRDSFSTNKPRR